MNQYLGLSLLSCQNNKRHTNQKKNSQKSKKEKKIIQIKIIILEKETEKNLWKGRNKKETIVKN